MSSGKTNSFLGEGLAFPFGFGKWDGGVTVNREQEHIENSIHQILATRIGERFMLPEFGSRLHELVFEPNTEVLRGLVRFYISEALRRWEKRVEILSINFGDLPANIDTGYFPVQIEYRIIQTQIEGNMVYPFYREVEA